MAPISPCFGCQRSGNRRCNSPLMRHVVRIQQRPALIRRHAGPQGFPTRCPGVDCAHPVHRFVRWRHSCVRAAARPRSSPARRTPGRCRITDFNRTPTTFACAFTALSTQKGKVQSSRRPRSFKRRNRLSRSKAFAQLSTPTPNPRKPSRTRARAALAPLSQTVSCVGWGQWSCYGAGSFPERSGNQRGRESFSGDVEPLGKPSGRKRLPTPSVSPARFRRGMGI